MIDNMPVIESTGALSKLTDSDKEMLAKNGRKIGGNICSCLRHNPESIGINMDKKGWVKVDEFIRKFNENSKKHRLSLPVLMEIVRTDEKQRYGLKYQGHDLMIRCNQGHSIPWLQMDYKIQDPPEVLYHGTITPFLDSIMSTGLNPQERQKVHLSKDIDTATKVAGRRASKGTPVILLIDAKKMSEDGVVFYLSENDVWLTDEVPHRYITILKTDL